MLPRLAPIAVAALLLAAPAVAADERAEDWAAWSRERALTLERWGQFENACDEWRIVGRLRPDDVEPLARAAVLAVDMAFVRGQDMPPDSIEYRVADTCIASAMTRGGQGDPALAYAIGRLRCTEQRWGAAWKMLGEARRGGFDPVRVRYWYFRASVNRAAELIDVGRAEEAVMALEEILREQPAHPDVRTARYLLAAGHDAMQEPDVARQMLDAMLKEGPDSPDCHFMLGLILGKQGRLEESEKELNRTITLAAQTKGQDQTRFNALLKLCDLQLKSGKVDAAEQTVLNLSEFAKDNHEVLYRLGRVRQAQEKLDEAVRLYRRVVRMRPTDIEILQNLQTALYLAGEHDESAEVGRRAQEIRTRRSSAADGGDAREPAPSKPAGDVTAPAPADGR